VKTLTWVVMAAVLAGLPAAQAQTAPAASSAATPPRSGLPPPGINDPGQQPQSVPLPSTGLKPSVAPAARQQDAKGQTSNVSVHTDANGDTVEEYRRNGQVYMVRVTPRHGVTQTYMNNNPNGSQVPDPRLGPVSPVYYDLYKWGGPAKPKSGSSSGH
jgi:Protein of unknown function (DUF2782)